MGNFSVKVTYANGNPARDIGVMINYGMFSGFDEKRTNSLGWVTFHNQGNKSGTIYVHGYRIGSHSLADGKTYSFTL